MVEKGFRVGKIYPVHPNLVLSTDNTTLFVYESKACGVGEEDMWDWKMVDATNNNLSMYWRIMGVAVIYLYGWRVSYTTLFFCRRTDGGGTVS